MTMLDYTENGLFARLFTSSSHEDCLCAFLNSVVPLVHPLVSATLRSEGQLSVVRRENTVIYIVTGQDSEGAKVEISMVLGVDNAMEPFLLQTFMQMVSQNHTGDLPPTGKIYYHTLMFTAQARDEGEGYKRVLSLENRNSPNAFSFITSQKFVTIAFEQFKFLDPFDKEQLWLAFLLGGAEDKFKTHPNLPEELKKAMEFACI